MAGISWGLWAIVANYPAGLESAIRSGFTQLVLSFIVASSLTSICSYMYRISSIKLLCYTLAILAPLIFQFCFQYSLHYISGTPYIIKTLTPVMCAGLLWVSFYTRRMAKSETSVGENFNASS